MSSHASQYVLLNKVAILIFIDKYLPVSEGYLTPRLRRDRSSILYTITQYPECKFLYIVKFKEIFVHLDFHQFIHIEFCQIKQRTKNRCGDIQLSQHLIHFRYCRHEFCYHAFIHIPAILHKCFLLRISIPRCYSKAVKSVVYLIS